jgi:hypothetical protein
MMRNSRIQDENTETKNIVVGVPGDSEARKKGRKKKSMVVARRVVARLPSRNAAEVPILLILAHAPGGEMRTKSVLNEIRCGKWFEELTTEDKEVVYEKSRKNVFDSIVKFSKKVLVIEKQVCPVGDATEVGVWKITQSGVERANKEGADWRPTFSLHEAIELDFEHSHSTT